MMKQEIHDPGAEGKPYDALEYFDILRKGASLNMLNTYDKLEGMIHVFYNNGHHEAEQYPNDVDSYEHDDTLYGARMVESAKLFKGNKVTIGMDVRKWGGTSKNLVTDTYYVKDKYLTDASVFGLVEQRFFDAVTLSGGARYTDDSKFGGFTAWQGGLIVNPTEFFKIHSSIAKGFNLPNLRQLYIKMFPAEVPNEDLDPEVYMSYDAGIELTPIKDLAFDVTGYHIDAEDKIVKDGTGWKNADEFNYNGLEATTKYTIMEMIGLRAGYSYIDNEYRKAKLTYVPKHKLLGGVSFDGYGIYAGLDAEYVYDIWHDAARYHRSFELPGAQRQARVHLHGALPRLREFEQPYGQGLFDVLWWSQRCSKPRILSDARFYRYGGAFGHAVASPCQPRRRYGMRGKGSEACGTRTKREDSDSPRLLRSFPLMPSLWHCKQCELNGRNAFKVVAISLS